jgi:hypothetical protein
MPAVRSTPLISIPEGQEAGIAETPAGTLAEARAAGRLEANKARVGEAAMRDLLRAWFQAPASQTARVLFRPYNGVSGWVEFTPAAIRLVKEDHWAGSERPLIERLERASDDHPDAHKDTDAATFRFHVWSTSAPAAVMRAMIFGQLREVLGVATNEAVLKHPVVEIVRASEAGPWRVERRQQGAAK